MDRRRFLAAGIAGTTGFASTGKTQDKAANDKNIRIVGVSCSPREGKTTATAIKVALAAAKQVDRRIRVDMLDLGGMDISGWTGGARPDEGRQVKDDFDLVLPMLSDLVPDGLIIGSPSYFRSMSALRFSARQSCFWRTSLQACWLSGAIGMAARNS